MTEDNYSLQWERVGEIIGQVPHCHGCGETFLPTDFCATLRISHESPLRLHKSCLMQLAMLFDVFLTSLDGEEERMN